MTAAEFIARLGGKGKMVRCPAHEDRTASLSVTDGDKGVLLKCHAGCKAEDVCRAMGLTMADLFFEKRNGNGSHHSQVVAEYDYRDKAGLRFQVVRQYPKTFRQRRPDGKGGWIWDMEGIERILFRLPEIERDVEHGLPIFVCEGEKDVLAMVEKGLSATCNPGGAGKWKASYSETLRDAGVTIIADKDEPGRKHAVDVSTSLEGIAKSVRTIELPNKNGKSVKDAHDFFSAGGTAQEIIAIIEQGTLPEILDAAAFITQELPKPIELVSGVLHQGSKLVLGGGSKSFKTWTLLDLALSIAYGRPWLSHDTRAGRVLYVNFEIQPWSWQARVRAVAEAKGTAIEPGRLSVWNLRGKAADFHALLPKIRNEVKQGFTLIILDPIYKLYGGLTDENKARDVAALLNGIEDLAVTTGAAVAFGAHFSKGNQAGKESIDRISGSGVFARDPDSLLVFTKHETEDAFTVEATLRNFPPVDPFVVRWEYPLMVPDKSLDPSRLKQVGGRKKEHEASALLDVLPDGGLENKEWMESAKTEHGIPERTFYRLRLELKAAGKVLKSKINDKWQPVRK